MRRFVREKWRLLVTGVLIAAVLVLASPVRMSTDTQSVSTPTLEIGQEQFSLVIGTKAYAAAVVDYACDGVDDNIQFQQALDALPAAGGKITVLAGDYSFGAVVLRAINNITIEGVGRSSYISRDAVNPIFSVGTQSNWVFRDIRFDAGGITLAAAVSYTLQNVAVGVTYHAMSVAGDVLPTLDSSYDIGAVGNEWAEGYFDNIYAPVGRAATFVVAASVNAAAGSMAQADYVCDGVNDQAEIQAAIDALPAMGGKVVLTEGYFFISAPIVLNGGHLTLQGAGRTISALVLQPGSNCSVISDPVGGCWYVRIADLHIDGKKADQASGHGIEIDDPAGSSHWIMERLSIVDTKEDGIHIDYGQTRYISQCVISGCSGRSIFGGANVDNSITVDHCSISSSGSWNIRLEGGILHRISYTYIEGGVGGSVALVAVTHSTMHGCYVKNVDTGGGSAIYWGASYSSFDNNDVAFCSGVSQLMSLAGGVCSISNNTFHGNNVDTGAQKRLLAVTGNRNTITGNTFEGDASALVIIYIAAVPGTVISSNDIFSNVTAVGILDSGTNSVITGNYISNNDKGISNTATSIVRDNIVVNNAVYNVQNPAFASRNHSDLFMDVLAVTANHVVNNENLSVAVPITFTIAAQPDVPRTLSGHFDAHVNITAYTIVITGVDAKGKTVTETFTEAVSPWDFETVNAFGTVTSIIMTARTGTGVADTMDIGITDVLGLSNAIYVTSGVYKIKKNNANAAVNAANVNGSTDTYDMVVIGLAATDDFTIWFSSGLNTPDTP